VSTAPSRLSGGLRELLARTYEPLDQNHWLRLAERAQPVRPPAAAV